MSSPIQGLFGLQLSAQNYSSSDNIYWKPATGIHQIRVCPPWNPQQNEVTRMIVNHGGYKTDQGNMRMPLCFNYAFTERPIGLALKTKGVIKPEDLQLYGKIGCVYCRISEVKIQMEGKKNNPTYPKVRYMWNILDRKDNKIYVFNSGKGLLEAVQMMYGMNNKFFDLQEGFDLMCTATGEKINRRYSYSPIANPVPFGADIAGIHDLDTCMAEGYTNIGEALKLIVASYPQMVNYLGLNQMAVPIG